MKKTILVIYHSQGGTMKKMADHFVKGIEREEDVEVKYRKAQDATIEDLLACDGIAIGSPEYFGTMAGMVKDFFDRTFDAAQEKTVGLPFVIFVCAGNDGRGAIAQIERIAAGYKWQKVQEHVRITGIPSPKQLTQLEELGHTLAAGIEFGIF